MHPCRKKVLISFNQKEKKNRSPALSWTGRFVLIVFFLKIMLFYRYFTCEMLINMILVTVESLGSLGLPSRWRMHAVISVCVCDDDGFVRNWCFPELFLIRLRFCGLFLVSYVIFSPLFLARVRDVWSAVLTEWETVCFCLYLWLVSKCRRWHRVCVCVCVCLHKNKVQATVIQLIFLCFMSNNPRLHVNLLLKAAHPSWCCSWTFGCL